MDEREEQLFYKASLGDIDSFEEFIKKYERAIYNASYRMMGNQMDAEDMAQESLIKIFKNLNTCKEPKAYVSWMYRIINNTCIDEIRRRKKRTDLSLDWTYDSEDGEMERELAIDETTPEDTLIIREGKTMVENAINNLQEDFRSIIVLRDIEGLSYEEISEVLDIKVGTVKSRLYRARAALKEIFENIEQNP